MEEWGGNDEIPEVSRHENQGVCGWIWGSWKAFIYLQLYGYKLKSPPDTYTKRQKTIVYIARDIWWIYK